MNKKILPDNVSHGNQNDRTGKYGLSPENYIYGAQSRAAFKIGTIPHSYEKRAVIITVKIWEFKIRIKHTGRRW